MKVPRGNRSLVIGPIPLSIAFVALWLYADYNLVTAKTSAKEVAHAGPARRTRSALVSVSFGNPKLYEFLDITEVSEEEQITREAEGYEAAKEGLATEGSSNTSAESDLGSKEYP